MPRGMWDDLLRLGIELESPVLAGGLLTTGPPQKSSCVILHLHVCILVLVLLRILSQRVQARSDLPQLVTSVDLQH